jgi:5-methylcytosine-specific restriction endonuclease McrA
MRTSTGQFLTGTENHWRPAQPFRDRMWLALNYIERGRTCTDIAREFGVRPEAVLYWMKKHGIPARPQTSNFGPGRCGADNPMWNRKGELNPNWKGGVSAERQAFYSSQEWKTACSEVWKRDHAMCQRCKLDYDAGMPLHIHHIVSFADKALRAEPSNLVLLCEGCHHFVHSRKNVSCEFLKNGV